MFGNRKKYEEAEEIWKNEIESLHKKECLNCPWNGITIFSDLYKQ